MTTEFYSAKTNPARKCNFTGEGMNEGWFIIEGELYAKYESDALNYIQQQGYTSIDDAYFAGAIEYLEFTIDEFYECEGIWSIR